MLYFRPVSLALGQIAALRVDRRGAAAVEFAFLLPVLLLILAGVTDGVRLITRGMQVKGAAQAGADYVQRKGWDEPGVRAAVINAGGPAAALDLAPRQFLGCLSGGAVLETTATTCPSGRASGHYVLISSSATFTPLMPWPRLALPETLRGQAMVRIP